MYKFNNHNIIQNNITCIIFSKDRPMQLRAYIESLLHFTEIKEQDITVILVYREEYDDVLKEFYEINWMIETDFHDNFCHAIENAKEFVLLAADDAVWIRPTYLSSCCPFLNDDAVTCRYSIGNNIVNNSSFMKFYYYKWAGTEGHLPYPFCVQTDMFRKAMIKSFLMGLKLRLTEPHRIEECGLIFMMDNFPESHVLFPNTTAPVVNIDINTMFSGNKIRTDKDMSTESLIKQYVNGERLVWKHLERIVPDDIFIGDKYWATYNINKK